MPKKLDDRAPMETLGFEPFRLPARRKVRSRSIAIDAAACFVATALGSLSPQALSLLELTPPKRIVVNADPISGKFTDRVLIGGLQPLSWEEPDAPRAPAFTTATATALGGGDNPPALSAPRAPVVAAKAAREKEAPAKRPERAPEVKAAEPVPAPAPAPAPVAAEDAAAPSQTAPGSADQGIFAALTPSGVSTKLGPIGQKVVSGAKSLGGAVIGGLSWIGY